MNALLIYPEFPDTYWSFKHALKFLGKRAAQPPLGLMTVATIQSYGMQVMGGFILGFDTDRDDIFDRMVEFIQKSGIPVAMVGLLQAMPGTQLFRRLGKEGRILDAGQGDNTDDKLNFLPHMDAARLIEGYRSILTRIYSCEA